MHAGDEGVAALDAVHEILLAQEIERAVDRDRGRPLRPGPPAIDDLVGAERLMARQQEPPARGGASASGAPCGRRMIASACAIASLVQRRWSWSGLRKTALRG